MRQKRSAHATIIQREKWKQDAAKQGTEPTQQRLHIGGVSATNTKAELAAVQEEVQAEKSFLKQFNLQTQAPADTKKRMSKAERMRLKKQQAKKQGTGAKATPASSKPKKPQSEAARALEMAKEAAEEAGLVMTTLDSDSDDNSDGEGGDMGYAAHPAVAGISSASTGPSKRLTKAEKRALLQQRLKEGSFADPSQWISALPEDKEREDMLQIRQGRGTNTDDMGGLAQLENSLLDLMPDEAIEMAQKKRVMHWDKRKKKYVKVRRCYISIGGTGRLRSCPRCSDQWPPCGLGLTLAPLGWFVLWYAD